MIFATGLALCVLAWIIFNVFGAPSVDCLNRADHVAGICAWLGSLLIGVSLLVMIAKVLP